MSPVVDLVLPPAEDWQAQARAARISTADLLAHAWLTAADFAEGVIARPDFPLSVPPHYLSLIRRDDPNDPLLLQVLARGEEALPQPGRLTDPLEEAGYRAAPGVLRKYRSRALLIASGACAIHCRYCFRRHYDYGAAMLTRSGEAEALAVIAGDAAIDEVILSGGDPLSLTDARMPGWPRWWRRLKRYRT
jgi:KamA family protein